MAKTFVKKENKKKNPKEQQPLKVQKFSPSKISCMYLFETVQKKTFSCHRWLITRCTAVTSLAPLLSCARSKLEQPKPGCAARHLSLSAATWHLEALSPRQGLTEPSYKGQAVYFHGFKIASTHRKEPGKVHRGFH